MDKTNQHYQIEQREDGDHWISLQALNRSCLAELENFPVNTPHHQALCMVTALLQSLLMEATGNLPNGLQPRTGDASVTIKMH